MSDTLRDRIAAVLADADGMPWDAWSKPSQDGYLLRADAVIEALELTDTLRLLRAAQIWIADAISEDDTGEPWLMTRMLLNNLVSRVDALEGYNDRFPA